MNAIRTIDMITSVANLRGITKYQPIRFWFICLFVNVNKMTKAYEDF